MLRSYQYALFRFSTELTTHVLLDETVDKITLSEAEHGPSSELVQVIATLRSRYIDGLMDKVRFNSPRGPDRPPDWSISALIYT
jgi:hypothetical protein